MMARSHALSGAAGWLGLCAAAGPLLDLHPTPVTVTAGAVVACGAAIAPDIDHPGSTMARSLGPITRIAARIVSWLSDAVRDGTCEHCDTPGTHGHRTLTHTALFALVVGVALCLAGRQWGLSVAAWIVGIGAAAAVLGLLRGKGTWPASAVSGVAVGVGVHWLGDGIDWWWLGLPVGVGMLLHTLGDALTEHGVPVLWPLRIRGCRWRRVGTPEWMRFRTGGAVEALVGALMLAGGGYAAWVLYGDQLLI